MDGWGWLLFSNISVLCIALIYFTFLSFLFLFGKYLNKKTRLYIELAPVAFALNVQFATGDICGYFCGNWHLRRCENKTRNEAAVIERNLNPAKGRDIN